MVKQQFEVNDLRLDQLCRNYRNQQLEVHFTQRMRGIRWDSRLNLGCCCLLRSIVKDQFYLSLLKSSFLLVCLGTTCALPQLKPTNQPNKQAVLPCLGQSYNHFFFSCFLIFSLIDFFMELKLSKGKFLQNSTQRYPIMNSLTVGSIIWWNQIPGEIVRGQSSELFKAHWAKSWNVRLQECHTFGQMRMKKMNREDLFSLSLVFLYAEFCSSS